MKLVPATLIYRRAEEQLKVQSLLRNSFPIQHLWVNFLQSPVNMLFSL